MTRTTPTTETELTAAREEFSDRWQSLQSRLSEEVGSAPRKKGWLILLLSVAAGVALGARRMNSGKSRRHLGSRSS
jgi:hypothetical protein